MADEKRMKVDNNDDKKQQEDDNHTFKLSCNYLVPYEKYPDCKFIPYDPSDPRGLPFPSGSLPYSSHSVVSEDRNSITITFQHGRYAEVGDTGTYEDAVIALARDMLSFKNDFHSPLRCREFSTAITHLEEALAWLHLRAARLQAEGKHGKS